MKFYKRNPHTALEGMSELTLEQVGAYNLIIDLLYARDGLVPDDDAAVARRLHLHSQRWRRLKTELMAAGKIWVSNDGLLKANGVDDCIKLVQNQSETARKAVTHRWEMRRLANELNGNGIRPHYERNTINSNSKISEISSSQSMQTAPPVDEVEKLYRLEPNSTAKSIATGELETLVQAKGWR